MISQTHRIRVLIVDDHNIVRRGLKAFLAQIDDIQVIGEADNGLEAVRLSQVLEPDVILMDLLMPKMDGIEAIWQIMTGQPHMRVLVMTSFVCDEKILPAIKAGAQGYLLKESEPRELVQSIYQLYRGEHTLPAAIARKMMQEISESPVENPTPDPLTARESDVLRLLAEGLTNEEIAARLGISEHTVRTHVKRVLMKLQLANRVQAALYALREGITSLDEEIQHHPGDAHSTIIGPASLSADHYWAAQPSGVDR